MKNVKDMHKALKHVFHLLINLLFIVAFINAIAQQNWHKYGYGVMYIWISWFCKNSQSEKMEKISLLFHIDLKFLLR